MNWNNIVTFFISAGAITGAIIYIGKRIVDKSLDLALEKYKSNLERELETHKNQLDKVLYEHQIKFGKLHQDRLEVIKQFNTKLIDIQNALEDLTAFFQESNFITDIEKEKNSLNELDHLNVLLEINQIYFNDNVCKRIRYIVDDGRRFVRKMSDIKKKEKESREKYENDETSNGELGVLWDNWLEFEREVQVKIKEARDEMTNEFRKLIGVE